MAGIWQMQMGCCFGRKSFRFCCRGCPSITESVSARLAYTLFLILGFVLMCVSLSPHLHDHLQQTSNSTVAETCLQLGFGSNCSLLLGPTAVYRVGCAMATFFSLLALATLGVGSSATPRAVIHNGLWFWKLLLFIGLIVAAFFIPEENLSHFKTAMLVIGMGGALIFIIIQMMLIVEFAHSWTDHWLDKVENGGSHCWFTAMIMCAMIFYSGVTAAAMFLFANYTSFSGCTTNKTLIGINVALCLVCALVATCPATEKHTGDMRAGLLQSSIITTYVTYLTWSALSSEPYPTAVKSPEEGMEPLHPLLPEPQAFLGPMEQFCGPSMPSFLTEDLISYIGMGITLLAVLYSTFQTSHNSPKLGLHPPSSKSCWDCIHSPSIQEDAELEPPENPVEVTRGGQKLRRNEYHQVRSSYSFIHATFAMASLYLLMQLTHWFRPENATLTRFERNWAAVWVKMVSSWICILIYLATLVLPRLCPGNLDRSRTAPQRHLCGGTRV